MIVSEPYVKRFRLNLTFHTSQNKSVMPVSSSVNEHTRKEIAEVFHQPAPRAWCCIHANVAHIE